MSTQFDSYNKAEKQFAQFGGAKSAHNLYNSNKANPGLSLQNLNNIPKSLKPKVNVPAGKGPSAQNYLKSKTQHGVNKSYDQVGELTSGRKLNSALSGGSQNQTNFSASYSKNFLNNVNASNNNFNNSTSRPKSSLKYSGVKSPTSHIFKSYRCHKYHTDLDFNYLTEQKFLKDAMSVGKDRLSTVALRSASPDKYFYDKAVNNHPQNRERFARIDNINSVDLRHGEDGKSKSKSREEIEVEGEIEGMDKSVKKPSQNILSDILDLQFSVNSPSKMKVIQSEMNQQKSEEFRQGQLKQQQKSKFQSGDRIYVDDEQHTKLTINLSYMGDNPHEKYIEALDAVMTCLDPVFEMLSLQERVEKFLEITEDQRRPVKLGAIVALYLILRKYHVEDNMKMLILEKVLYLLQNYESQEELFLVALLEIATLFAPHELLFENIPLIGMFITDFNFPRLQKASFNCLMCMEYEGIKTLVEMASKDYQEYQKYILTNLIKTPHIQKIIIIKALLNEVYSNNPEKRHSSLAALNRMHDLVGDPETLNKLSKFFHDSKLEKIFLSSTIRTAGDPGEQILLHEIKTNKDFSVRVAIASVLAYRLPRYPKYLEVRLDKNDTYSITKCLPGSFCTYYGRVSPYVYEEREETFEELEIGNIGEKQNKSQQNEFLEVSTRDFLASLQRMLIMNYDHTNPQLVHQGKYNILDNLDLKWIKNESFQKYTNYFELNDPEVNPETDLYDERGKRYISEEVIKALCLCLKDYSTAVRDTAAGSLGQIGIPESLLAVDYLLDTIRDEDVNVKSKVIWAIGRIAGGCENSLIPPIVDALKSNMWKVKSACLYTLSQFGFRCAKLALPVLNKLLRESAINKQTIAETVVKLGTEGESTLLKLMATENESNYKLKGSVAKALALANVNSPNIDFIVECLFKAANSQSPLIRKSALFSIRVLAEKSDERVTYLKRKNIIPFYYDKLQDKDQSIQAYAISCIKSLGPQGELIFIEGLTKDLNPNIRMNCAIGLAGIGPHTLRTLLYGLHDENLLVRKTVEKEIIEKFAVEDVLNAFADKSSQKMSLKIAIRDAIEKDSSITQGSKKYFQSILIALEKEGNYQNYGNDSQLVYNNE
jgi:HEAT repeat protein